MDTDVAHVFYADDNSLQRFLNVYDFGLASATACIPCWLEPWCSETRLLRGLSATSEIQVVEMQVPIPIHFKPMNGR